MVKKITSMLTTVLLILAVAMALFVIWQKFNPSGPSGYQVMAVYSGSMSPAIDTGALILLRPSDPTKIKKRDIITFKQPRPKDSTSRKANAVTHRVVKVLDGPRGLAFQTKGDANKEADPINVDANQVTGKVILDVPRVGYLFGFIRQPLGFVLLIILPGLLLVAGEIRNIVHQSRETRDVSQES